MRAEVLAYPRRLNFEDDATITAPGEVHWLGLTLTLTLTLTLALTLALTLPLDPDTDTGPGPNPGPNPDPNPDRSRCIGDSGRCLRPSASCSATEP